MDVYTYLHDMAKPQCMNIETSGKQQRIFTMDEWHQLVSDNGGNEQSALQALEERGYVKIGYRIGKKLAQESGTEEKDHGPEVVRVIEQMREDDQEISEFGDQYELVLSGVANHEIHFQVFNNTSTARQYEKFLASQFIEEEIDFIYSVCLIDISGSLGEDGQPDYQGYKNMIIARENYNLIVNSGLKNTEPLMNLNSIEEVRAKISQLKDEETRKEVLRQVTLESEDLDRIMEKTAEWGIDNERDRLDLRKALESLVEQENSIGSLGRVLPPKLRPYIKQVKHYLESKSSL